MYDGDYCEMSGAPTAGAPGAAAVGAAATAMLNGARAHKKAAGAESLGTLAYILTPRIKDLIGELTFTESICCFSQTFRKTIRAVLNERIENISPETLKTLYRLAIRDAGLHKPPLINAVKETIGRQLVERLPPEELESFIYEGTAADAVTIKSSKLDTWIGYVQEVPAMGSPSRSSISSITNEKLQLIKQRLNQLAAGVPEKDLMPFPVRIVTSAAGVTPA